VTTSTSLFLSFLPLGDLMSKRASITTGISLGSNAPSWGIFLYLSAGAIFLTITKLFLSSNRVLLIYIAYCTTVLSYQCLKGSYFISKGVLLLPLLPQVKGRRGICFPLPHSLASPLTEILEGGAILAISFNSL